MSELKHEKKFKLNGGGSMTLSIFENRMLFIHSVFISAQWVLDKTGVEVSDNINSIKLALHNHNIETYQSFYFELEESEKLYLYFKALRYPLRGYKQSVSMANISREKEIKH